MFCTTCLKSSCIDCIDQEQHNSHLFKPIKSELAECLPPLKAGEAKIDACMENITEINASINMLRAEIQETKNRAMEKLNSYKAKEIAEIEAKYKPYIADINEQENKLLEDLQNKVIKLAKYMTVYGEIQNNISDVLRLPVYELVEQQTNLLSKVDKTLSTHKINKQDFLLNCTSIYDV